MRRLLGLLLMIRGLSPFLVLLVIGIAGAIMYGDLRAATAGPIESLQARIAEAREAIDAVRNDIDAVVDEVSDVVAALQNFSLPDLLPDIPDNISIPRLTIPAINVPLPDVTSLGFTMCSLDVGVADLPYPCDVSMSTFNFRLDIPDIPSFNLPLPGLGQLDDLLREAFSPITDIFAVFQPLFAGINSLSESLQVVPEAFTAIVEAGRTMVSDVSQVLTQWGQTLLVVFVALAVLAVIYFAVPLIDNVTRGWRMLRGLPVE